MKPHGICPQDVSWPVVGVFFNQYHPCHENSRDWPKADFFSLQCFLHQDFSRISPRSLCCFFPLWLVLPSKYRNQTWLLQYRKGGSNTGHQKPIQGRKTSSKRWFLTCVLVWIRVFQLFFVVNKVTTKESPFGRNIWVFKLGYAEVSISSMQCWRPSVGLGITQGQVDGKWKFGYIQPVCNRHHQDDIICLVRDP